MSIDDESDILDIAVALRFYGKYAEPKGHSDVTPAYDRANRVLLRIREQLQKDNPELWQRIF
jgi:hypothetical protein